MGHRQRDLRSSRCGLAKPNTDHNLLEQALAALGEVGQSIVESLRASKQNMSDIVDTNVLLILDHALAQCASAECRQISRYRLPARNSTRQTNEAADASQARRQALPAQVSCKADRWHPLLRLSMINSSRLITSLFKTRLLAGGFEHFIFPHIGDDRLIK